MSVERCGLLLVRVHHNMAAAARELQCTSTSSPPASAQLTALAEQLVECARQIMDPYCPAEQRQQYQKVMIKCVCSLHVTPCSCIHACHCLFICLYLLLAFCCLICSPCHCLFICLYLSLAFYCLICSPCHCLFIRHLFVLIFCFLLSDLFSLNANCEDN